VGIPYMLFSNYLSNRVHSHEVQAAFAEFDESTSGSGHNIIRRLHSDKKHLRSPIGSWSA